MNRTFRVIEEHECEIIKNHNKIVNIQEIAIQKEENGYWFWVRYSNGNRENIAMGIGYCPYCGEELKTENKGK